MRESKHTPGPWELQRGHSDWGLPCSHIIVQAGDTGNDCDTWIAEVPSVTPYCAGASRKDRDRASRQYANAVLIEAAPDLLRVLRNWLDAEDAYEGDPENDEHIALAKEAARAVLSKIEGRP